MGWGWHLPPQSQKEQVQGVRSRGALTMNHIGFCPERSVMLPPRSFFISLPAVRGLMLGETFTDSYINSTYCTR